MITKDLNFNQLVNYIKDNAGPDLLVITQDKIFRDALNRKLNEICLNEENWVRKSTKILTLTQWYNMLWDKCRLRCILNGTHPLPRIIDNTSEIIIWRDLVAKWIKGEKGRKERPLINANGAADNMRKSWVFLAMHNFISCRLAALLPDAEISESNINDPTGQCQTFLACLQRGDADDNGVLQPDHKAFLEIAGQYRSYMNKHEAVSAALIPNALAERMEQGDLNPSLPKNIILANFSRPTGQLYRFFELLENKYRCAITLLKYPDAKTDSKCKVALLTKGSGETHNNPKSPFDSLEEELVYSAKQAQKVSAEDPRRRAAVIIPQLRGSVSDMTLILDKALAPRTLICGQENTERPYVLKSGEAILKHPVIQDVLNLLRLSMSTLSRQKLINIISGGFLNTKDKLADKAELCKKLRRDFHSIYTLEDFKQAIEDYNGPAQKRNENFAADGKPSKRLPLAGLHRIVEKIYKLKDSCLGLHKDDPRTDSLSEAHPLSHWAYFADKLIKSSFSLYKISIISKSADNAVGSLIKVLYKLSRVSERHYQANVDFKTFMQYLRLLLIDRENNLYYRQDTDELRILNVKQALSSCFTHLYLIQFNDSLFPAPVSSQGFIPTKILDFLGFEKANAKQALEAARRSICGLTYVTDNLFLSFANTQEKSGSLLPSAVSPLWKNLRKLNSHNGWTEMPVEAAEGEIAKESWDPGFICCKDKDIWEQIEEAKVPAALPNKLIEDKENGRTERGFKGGTALINAMCNCPFKAFLTYRLRCEDDNPADEGLSYTDRGSIIHEVMENTWKELEKRRQDNAPEQSSREFLKAYKIEDLHNIIDNEIDSCLQNVHADSQIFVREGAENLLKINEKHRLQAILYPWFEKCETGRSDFNIDIDKLEKPFICSIELSENRVFTFDGRADRVDKRVNDSSNVVIDYKSGKNAASIYSWGIETDRDNQEQQKENKSPVNYPLQNGKNYQLPVYAAFGIGCSEKCQELSFGKLTLEDAGFKTLDSDFTGIKPDKKNKLFSDDWDSQIRDWKGMVTQRLEEFMAGGSYKANPTEQNCRYCHLMSVCPYKNAGQDDAGEEDS